MGEQSEREKRRQERIEGEGSAAGANRNRLIVGYAIASTVVLAIAVAVFVLAGGGAAAAAAAGRRPHQPQRLDRLHQRRSSRTNRAGTVPAAAKVTNLAAAAKAAGCDLRLHLKDEGHDHIPVGSQPPDYKTNPPTSGNHVEPPYQQADGAYPKCRRKSTIVHSLEHGRLEIQYAPDLPEKDQLALVGLYDTMYGAALLFPNDKMPYEVAATTWTNLLGCPTYKGAATLDAIRAFGKATWGRYGGEPVRAFTFTGPTPAEPAE